jgi:hypothetical protein
MVEHITGDQDGIHLLLGRDLGDFGQDLACLVKARVARERLAYMPVAGVEQSH